MSATIVRQGGWELPEQSDIRLALKMAKMAKEGFSHPAIAEMQHLIKKPCAEVQEEKKRGVQFPWHNMGNTAIERHLAMVYKNQMDGCLPCQNGTEKHPQTCWRHKGTGAPPSELVAASPGTPPLPRTPPVPPSDTEGSESDEIEGMPSRCVYIHSPLPNTQFSIIIHIPEIASAIKILFQICWVHYVLCSNMADFDFEDESRLWSESDSKDKHWLKGTGFLSIIIIYN